MGNYVGGNQFKLVPDSIYIKWSSEVDDILYEGKFKLPREKIFKLFKNGVTDLSGKREDYSLIIAGAAPGGNITVWMQSGRILTEIAKYKAKNCGIWMAENKEYQKFKKEIRNSKAYQNSETSIFQYLHGLPYNIWETGEKEFQYDIGFTCEDKNKQDYSIAIAGYTKDGSVVYSNEDPIPYRNWDKKMNLEVKKNKKLPVQLYLQWISKDDQQWYEAQIVLPNNLENHLLSFQKKYGKKYFFNYWNG